MPAEGPAIDPSGESAAEALARLYDLDLAEDPGDVELYLALAARSGDPVVELAVGSGRLAVPLTLAGHQVVGLDNDPAMLERARRRAVEAGVSMVDFSKPDVPVGGALELALHDVVVPRPGDHGRYALVVLGLNSLLLFPDRGAQARIVATMTELARPGGLVVVDAWQPQPDDLVRMDGRLSLEWLREDPGTGRPVAKLTSAWYDPATRVAAVTSLFDEGGRGEPVVRWTRTDRMRFASGEELVAWAESAGLEVERLAGDVDLAPYGGASERAVLVARRPG